jgi:hypothetical protein
MLGSVLISAPAGFVITAAPGSSSFTPSSALFLDLAVAPSATTTVTVTAAATCAGGSYQWGVEAKQSNDFSGTGNLFQLDSESLGNLSGTPTGSCSLTFAAGEPDTTNINSVITTAINSTGGPVTVEVLDASGNVDTSSTAAVTVAIGPSEGSGSLSGTLTVNASGGIASFSDLSIDLSGVYSLAATSPGITSMNSGSFTISQISPCSVAPCTASATSATTMGTVTSAPTTSGEVLSVGIGGVTYTCGGTYQPVSDPFSFELLKSNGAPDLNAQFTTVLEIFKATVEASGRTGASSWEICYASIQPFTALPGTASTAVIGGVTYNTGLLPDCTNTPVRPCVQDRHKDNAGDVVVTVLAAGDPFVDG